MNEIPKPNNQQPVRITHLGSISTGIAILLFVAPVTAILLLILTGVGISTYVGPSSADAGGWIILFGFAFLGPIGIILFFLSSLSGIGLGLFAIFRYKEQPAVPLLGILLNILAVLSNLCLFVFLLFNMTA